MIAGSVSYGSPSSRRPTRRSRAGRSSGRVSGRNPSVNADATSSRVSSVVSAAADDAPAAAEHRDGDAIRRVVGEQRFFRRGALAAQRLALREGQPRRRQLLLDERREREVEVVAAEQQVLADGDALEGQLVALDARRGSG